MVDNNRRAILTYYYIHVITHFNKLCTWIYFRDYPGSSYSIITFVVVDADCFHFDSTFFSLIIKTLSAIQFTDMSHSNIPNSFSNTTSERLSIVRLDNFSIISLTVILLVISFLC